VPSRSRFASRLTLWAFAAALALKSAVPMLAAAAAGLQGRAVAEICDVYGVATMPPEPTAAGAMTMLGIGGDGYEEAAGGEPEHAHGGTAAPEHVHVHAQVSAHDPAHAGVVVPTTSHDDAPPADHRHGGAAGDHCALTAMVAIGSGGAPPPAAAMAGAGPGIAVAGAEDAFFDAVARWAALLEHGPPVFS